MRPFLINAPPHAPGPKSKRVQEDARDACLLVQFGEQLRFQFLAFACITHRVRRSETSSKKKKIFYWHHCFFQSLFSVGRYELSKETPLKGIGDGTQI